MVLAIASAGWVFDTFEGQLFNITRADLLTDLLAGQEGIEAAKRRWGDIFLAVFLLGGTIGGIVFGALADRFGRKRIMSVTILVYSIFSGLTYFATELWHVAVLRFLVAMGVGGEWSVAAALVAEVFQPAARARASGIFHATSVLGTWLAAVVGMMVVDQWRLAYVIGVLPAMLVFIVRSQLEEPTRWRESVAMQPARGTFREIWEDPRWRWHALLGVLLAGVGLGTFWGVTVAGQDLAQELLLKLGRSKAEAAESAKFAYGFVLTAGSGIGLLSFGPLAERVGRRSAFAIVQVLSLVMVPITCFLPRSYETLLLLLPLYGMLTISMHAGFAVYFPELFPDRVRATGVGICFNGGRLLAAPILVMSGELKARLGVGQAVSLLSLLFLLGLIVVLFLPETKGKPLPK
ncbi:MFS transporter [bacterium]|nr:MFS transporter [bacterium]